MENSKQLYRTFKVRGIEFQVNGFGHLLACSDMETVYPASWRRKAGQEHYGTNADLFVQGLGGQFFATPKFLAATAGGPGMHLTAV
jgi:hypothetical protein